MSRPVRLILDPPRRAALNMAIDEILMESRQAPDAPPVLRFYFWSEPAYSIGYFQSVEAVARRFGCAKKKIGVVRRLAGGGTVLHGEDLTFSLTLKNPNLFFSGDVKTSYLKINEAVRIGLKDAYPELDYADCRTVPPGRPGARERVCFEAPSCYDLLLEGKKILGASQRRAGGAILHQSTIFLKEDPERLIEKIRRGFEKNWGVEFQEKALTQEELKKAELKEKERYASPEWAFKP